MGMNLIVPDAEKSEDPVWCHYEGNVYAAIRPLSNKKSLEIIEEHTRRKTVWKKGRKFVDEEIDHKAVENDTRDWIVADWKGVCRVEGDDEIEVDCEREVKLRVLDFDHEFRSWCIERSTDFAGLQEQAKKNKKNGLPKQ